VGQTGQHKYARQADQEKKDARADFILTSDAFVYFSKYEM